jgi:hypothetical protein
MLKIIENDCYSINYRKISSNIIYCLYHTIKNVIVDDTEVLEDICLVAYSDNEYDLLSYMMLLIDDEIYSLSELSITKIPKFN